MSCRIKLTHVAVKIKETQKMRWLQNRFSPIFSQFLKDMKQTYIQCYQPAEIVRDFISGMTDQYFLDQCPEQLRPQIESI